METLNVLLVVRMALRSGAFGSTVSLKQTRCVA